MGIFSQRGAFPKPGIRQLPYSPFGGRARNMRFNPYQQRRPFMGGGMGGFNPYQQRRPFMGGGMGGFNPYQQQRPQPFMGGGMGGFNPYQQQRPQPFMGRGMGGFNPYQQQRRPFMGGGFNPYQQQRPQPFMGRGMGDFNPPQQRPQSLAGGPSITNRERREALHARHEMLPDESRTKQRLARYIGDLDDAFAASGESASAFPGMQQINADVYSDYSSLSPSDMAEIQATAPPPQAQAMAPPPQVQAMAPFEDSGMPWDETQAMAPPPQAQAMAPFQMAAPAPAMPPQPVAPRPSRRDYGDQGLASIPLAGNFNMAMPWDQL